MASEPEWLTLDEGEELVWSGQPRLMSIAGTVVRAVVRTVVVAAVAFAVAGGPLDSVVAPLPLVPAPSTLVPATALFGVVGLVVALAVYQVVRAYLVVTNVDYVLTDRNLYKKTGVLSEHVTRVGVDRIQRTSLSKDFLGTRFDYGSVAVSTAGSSGVEMVLSNLDAPDELRNELRRRANEAGAAAGAGVSEAALRDVLDEVRQLRETTTAVEEVLR